MTLFAPGTSQQTINAVNSALGHISPNDPNFNIGPWADPNYTPSAGALRQIVGPTVAPPSGPLFTTQGPGDGLAPPSMPQGPGAQLAPPMPHFRPTPAQMPAQMPAQTSSYNPTLGNLGGNINQQAQAAASQRLMPSLPNWRGMDQDIAQRGIQQMAQPAQQMAQPAQQGFSDGLSSLMAAIISRPPNWR